MPRKKRILFISRSYPPLTGGIENQNEAVYEHLCLHYSVTKIANSKGKLFLPLFFPWAIFKSLFVLPSVETIVLGDGVLSIIAWVIKKFTHKKKVICIIHGLDVTYPNRLYQSLWIKRFFRSIDHFVTVSNNSKNLLLALAIKEKKITTIPNGIKIVPKSNINDTLENFHNYTGIKDSHRKILLSLGRLVKRKGVSWFISNVLPRLDETVIYLIAGDGPEKKHIEKIIAKHQLTERVILLGKVSEQKKQLLFSHSDLFVQPNIKVINDVEGFGISVIEAGMFGLPVLASNIEGLRDAIKDGENGWLVESAMPNDYISKINYLLQDRENLKLYGQKFRKYNIKNYQWDLIIQDYCKVIESY